MRRAAPYPIILNSSPKPEPNRMNLTLSDDDLTRMRTDTENNFVERKPLAAKADWLQVAVAFANSAPIGYPAILFIGVKDDGTPESTNADHDWEKQQVTVSREISRAYPPIYCVYKILRDDASQECLAVIIPGSPDRPHFAGKSYVRIGPQTKEVSGAQFDRLVAERSSKAYKIREWIGKEIGFARIEQGVLRSRPATLLDCNQHYVSVSVEWNRTNIGPPTSYPLNRTEISFNNSMNCLELEIRDLP
jgi:Putative DNA-binding domain